MTITLIDARSTSLTVSWPAVEGATRYILEYRTNDADDFELLSEKLTQTQARKRNLPPSTSYYFRVAGVLNNDDTTTTQGDWVHHEEPLSTLSTEADEKSMEALKVTHAGSNQALVVSWSSKVVVAGGGDAKYELQMRENLGGAEWSTIAPALSGTQVKKKNLTSKQGYLFRVRPTTTKNTTAGDDDDDDGNVPFSPPSEAVVARGLSLGIRRFFDSLEDGTLLRSGVQQPVPLADALGGKEFVLLYASASWCPPCRQFTPKLADWYKKPTVRDQVEVVFLSCDHDANGFKNYFSSHHPWMAGKLRRRRRKKES
jgi:thiol-disulfide isomerase/thioredoxin